MLKILLVAGARPNFMKIAPLIHELKSRNDICYRLVHTGQHYDYKMSKTFFVDLNIPKPDYFLKVGSDSHAVQTAKIMVSFEKVCISYSPNIVIVVGDVNSTLACSITAKKLAIKVAHIEAGLRSFDREMPEELNRIVTDSISDYYFITEISGKVNLINEGVNKKAIFYSGNLMIDTLYYALDKIKMKKKFSSSNYGVVTLHRPSNVDDKLILEELIEVLNEISKKIILYFPLHPRTKKSLKLFNLNNKISKSVHLLPPASYLSFLHMFRDAKVIFTDSGGIQEEATVLRVPCYTFRYNTERPITITQGTNRLVGNKKNKILDSFNKNTFNIDKNYNIPEYWDGKSAKRIIEKISTFDI